MQFGICTATENSTDVKNAGWDFVEENIQTLLQGDLPDAQWQGRERVAAAALSVPAANRLVPAALKITGPTADPGPLRRYMERVLSRSATLGIKTLVFGSGDARMVPEGFDRETARRQIIDFVRMSSDLAARHDILLVAEHLNRGECNIINSVAEAMDYVTAVDHPNFQCLVDSYHFWLENEPLESLRDAMPWIRHVHLADTKDRVAPGESGERDYRPLFGVLKDGCYDGLISIEPTSFPDIPGAGPRVRAFLKKQWEEA